MQIRVVLDKLEYVKPEVATLVFYFIVTVRRVLFNFHRFAMRGTRRIAAALTICALCVLRESVASLPSRCDGVRYIYAWGTCLECSLNALPGLSVCPSNYNKITTGQGIRRCSFRLHFGADFGYIIVPGCQHRCARTVVQKECCDGFWGSDCQACPGLPACSGQGVCSDKVKGNGTCTCKTGFKGFACELCSDPNKFGLYCNDTCTCVHGQCDSGVNGTGHCMPNSCHLGYTGNDCNISFPKCPSVHQCQANATCFQVVNNTYTCLCDPGFRNSNNSCVAINPCQDNTHHCHNHAECHYLGPGRHNCACAAGYRGDGIVCEAVDPCQKDNGGCPSNSTLCNYLTPGKSTCTCLPGFQNVTSSNSCSVINLCENNGGCDTNANCSMEEPGMKRCLCNDGYRGNGIVCYGNILQRVNELNLHGPSGLKGELSTAIDLLSRSLARPLSGAGPFTLFLMVNKAFSNLTKDELNQLLTSTDMAWHFVSRHIIASDVDSFLLKKYKTLTTLQGINVTVIENQNVTYVNLDGQHRNATVLFSDLLAGNGMIHVIDKIMWQFGDFQNTSFKLSSQVIQERAEFRIFASLLLVSGVASEISDLDGPLTFLAPTDSAFKKMDNITFNYLTATDMGKEKMKSLLRNHILSSKVAVTDLIYWNKVTSLEGESLVVQLTSRGQIVLDGNAHVTESNIVTSDCMIHVTDTLLIPDDIEPLLKNFCEKPVYTRGACYRCDAIEVMRNKGCQEGYEPTSSKSFCRYIISRGGIPLGIFSGCLITRCRGEVSICCAGFFGSPCHPCPGPFYNPCYGNGKCSDGMNGNGTCHCKPNFKGTACEQCADDNKFGPFCNQTCTCVNGKCHNAPESNGTCKHDSCLTGFHGMNCDQNDVQCPSSRSLRCHVMASCVHDNNVDRCKCNAGYEGSGEHCYEINPCLEPDRGGCHHEATCTKTGPGTRNCTCDDGFLGDGIVCVPVDPCQEQGGGNCHSNADCRYKGPGQSDCVCKPGYTGDGFSCVEINPCLVNNGGCAQDARCFRNGPDNHTCLCNLGFIGNGYICFGSISTVISRINHNLETLLRTGNMWHYLSNPTKNLTVLAPSVTALSQLPENDTRYWTNTTDRLAYLLKNHVLNETYTIVELKNKTSLTMSNDLPLAVTVQGNKLLIGGRANVVEANITAANGLVHVIDKVLLPPRLPPGDELPLTSELLRNRTEFFDFYNLLKGSSLLRTLDACQACTIFAPISSALQEHVLLQNKTLSSDTLKYHVVKHYLSEEAIHNGQEFSTWLDESYVKVTKPSEGKLKVNGIDVSVKGQKARRAVVYGLNGVLRPIRNHCDKIVSTYGRGPCTSCPFFTPTCPSGWTRVLISNDSCWIFFPVFKGCTALCRKDTINEQCCVGFWGKDCQACPGNLTVPCSGQGECDDGKAGSGHCTCQANFTGTACERCGSHRYGANCQKECDTCINGICNEGKSGDGKCLCYHGWKGQYCNVSANFSNCHPTICSQHATCYGPAGVATCQCDTGYTGNGTSCAEINPCDDNNGGCDENANCTANINLPRFSSCQCKDGFSGDGLYCFAIDPCQENNGGCHENATCASIAPGKRNCFCKEGFSGDGIHCVGVNPCDVDNGGCSDRAYCKQIAPTKRQCTCKVDYVGDGITCIGDIMEALSLDPELTEMDKLIKNFGLDKLLASNGFSNLLAPVNNALEKLPSGRRKRRSLESQSDQLEVVLKYHILSCVRITNHTFLGNESTNFTTLLGSTLTVKREGNEVSFVDSYGNVSKVVRVYEASNGVIMKLDNVLTPSVRGSEPQGSFVEVASQLGYTEFVNLVQLAGLTNPLRAPIGRPALMFWPTNRAINSIPQDLRDRLLNPANLADLVHVVEYHVVVQITNDFGTKSFLRNGAGMELRTLEGASLFVACKGGKGELYVNAESRIIARDIAFDGGVAFGVDTLLVPLEFGGNCDEITERQLKGQCSNCFLPTTCPQETSLVGTTNHGCVYDADLVGCQPICLQRNKVQRCCTNFYGPKCLVCPGGVQSPCNGRGNCIDGLQGSGQCVCDLPFNGTACEMCTGHSDLCAAPTASCEDNNGGCHVFATCSETADNHVNCTCLPGYHGDGYYCEMTDVCATNNGECPDNSTCHFSGPGTRICLCNAGFYPFSGACRAHHPRASCRQNHGGCSVHADCFDIGAGAVCVCRSGFIGDGYGCSSHIAQVIRETREALEFNKVLYQLSAISTEGLSLLNDLQNKSKEFTVFAPVNSAVNHKKFTLLVMKNHILHGRLPLTSLRERRSVKTLAGTDLLVKKLGNGKVVINGVAHVVGDLSATNGLIHMIDQMLPVIEPPPSATTAPTKPKSTDISTTASTTTINVPPPSSAGTPTESDISTTASTTTSGIFPQPSARRLEHNPVGKGAIGGIILGTILCVLLIAVVYWLLKKRKCPSGASYKKEPATVQFSNEAFNDNSMVSFSSPLYDNFEEPVVLPPLDFPADDKRPIPNQGAEHLDFENPLYDEMQDVDVRDDADGAYDVPEKKQFSLDSSFVPGQEDTC